MFFRCNSRNENLALSAGPYSDAIVSRNLDGCYIRRSLGKSIRELNCGASRTIPSEVSCSIHLTADQEITIPTVNAVQFERRRKNPTHVGGYSLVRVEERQPLAFSAGCV
jgi:hypothetical protein